jgi:hypothetical protein
MPMTDGGIGAAMQSGKLGIENLSETNLEAASYGMRFGDRLLISSNAGWRRAKPRLWFCEETRCAIQSDINVCALGCSGGLRPSVGAQRAPLQFMSLSMEMVWSHSNIRSPRRSRVPRGEAAV